MYAEAWGQGGIESFLMNVFRRLSGNGFTFDLFSTWDWSDAADEELEKLSVHRITVFHGHRPGQLTRLRDGLKGFGEALSKEGYDAVYVNTMNGLGFLYAREAARRGVPVRVVHSHNSDVGEGAKTLKRAVGRMGSLLFGGYATARAACSTAAGEHLFGRRGFTVVRNGVDTERFRFDAAARERVRNEIGVGPEAPLVGNIGRIAPAKNPLFQLEVFAELLELAPDARYLMVGGNEMGDAVPEKARALGIQERVSVLPPVANPAPYYSALDAFLMPSLFEGLGTVRVEAQCSGLPVLCSDVLPIEGDVTDLARNRSLDDPSSRWAEDLMEMLARRGDRDSYSQAVANAGWSAEASAETVGRLLAGSNLGSFSKDRAEGEQDA